MNALGFLSNSNDWITFFLVLVRYSVLVVVLPIVGDRSIPNTIKILFSLALSVCTFPYLKQQGWISFNEQWTKDASALVSAVALEVGVGLALGFTSRLIFDGINFGANLVGSFMGFASASFYDPHQESQSQVIAEIQLILAMLLFLVLDGHHLMIRAALSSYSLVPIGKAGFSILFSQRLILMTQETIKLGILFSAPVGVSLFAVNVAFGVFSKAMPQLNVLVLSFAISALVGFFVLFVSWENMTTVITEHFLTMEKWILLMLKSIQLDGA